VIGIVDGVDQRVQQARTQLPSGAEEPLVTADRRQLRKLLLQLGPQQVSVRRFGAHRHDNHRRPVRELVGTEIGARRVRRGRQATRPQAAR
jgi:hypothetical protein